MRRETLLGLNAVVFALVALLHLVRVALGWPASVNARDVPMWASWLGLVLAGALAWSNLRARRVAER